MYSELGLLIDGRWIGPSERSGSDVLNPATGLPIAKLPHATKADLDLALEVAGKAFRQWRDVSAFDRAKVLRRAAQLMRDRIETIARVMTLEQGKPVAEAKGEIEFAADTIDWMADEGRRAYGRVIPSRFLHGRVMVLQEPVGPVAAFTPWNAPALTNARKIAPALAAGCSIILKAAEETPGTAVEMARCFEDAGLPKGVLQLVFGVPAEVSSHLIASPIIRKISFTGSVAVGIHLTKLAAEGMKRVTMELGGQAPVIVFDDADVAHAVQQTASFKYRNAGQICAAPNRFFVHEAVHAEFVDRFASYARSLKVGDGLDPGTNMGPLANPRRLDAMEALVADGKKHGGEVVAGGVRRGNEGFFFEPTVITGLDDEARLMREEPFGPVAPVVTFREFDEVVERANSAPLGLSAFAFTASEKRARAIADRIEAGLVAINTGGTSLPESPFGGVKYSGTGHEGGVEGLEAYTVKKLVNQY